MNTPSSTIVQRLWNCCNVLRGERRLDEDGVNNVPKVEFKTFGTICWGSMESRRLLEQ